MVEVDETLCGHPIREIAGTQVGLDEDPALEEGLDERRLPQRELAEQQHIEAAIGAHMGDHFTETT